MNKISINTVRQLAAKVYNHYDLEESYCHLVGKSNRSPANALKVYRLTANGSTGEWLTARELVDILNKVIEVKNIH